MLEDTGGSYLYSESRLLAAVGLRDHVVVETKDAVLVAPKNRVQEVKKLVTAIHASPAWTRGRNAIVVVWDENDYSVQPIINKVVAIVDTSYGVHQRQSAQFYTHFSLLRTIEGGFGIPCLNHACDATTNTISDLFGEF